MIDEARLSNNLKELSFPRLSGTKYEKKCFNITKQKIKDLDLTPSVQEFLFSTFYSRIYPKVSLTLLSWLLVILSLNINIAFTLINLCLILISILILILFTRNPEKIRLGKKHNSQNLFVKLLSQNMHKTSNYNIFFFSHLDSKGQAFSIKIRILLYYTWLISFPLSLLFIIFNSFVLVEDFILLYSFSILILIINCVASSLLWINTTNNKSKGAIDNASGISIVLELLYYYSNPKNRLKNYNLWFVFTGAEESGTMGIRNFYQCIKDFDREKTFIINFDSIANRVYLWDHGLLTNNNTKALNYILDNNNIMSLEKARRIYIGTYSDGLFLRNKKFKGLGNGDKTSYNYLHSVNDDVDKIEIGVLKKLCNFYTILLSEVDINLKK
ncbi:MAG: M28 family peptidase [Promethearchaeota archaeon]